MDCAEFLEHYSDLRDATAPPALLRTLERHRASCPACARYDRVVRRGVQIACALPAVELSADFEARLQHRLFHVEDEMARARALRPLRTAAGAALLAAAAAGVVWGPLGRREVVARLPGLAASPPQRVAAAAAHRHLASQLADLGVPVLNTPYRDLVFRESPLSARIAEYAVAAQPSR